MTRIMKIVTIMITTMVILILTMNSMISRNGWATRCGKCNFVNVTRNVLFENAVWNPDQMSRSNIPKQFRFETDEKRNSISFNALITQIWARTIRARTWKHDSENGDRPWERWSGVGNYLYRSVSFGTSQSGQRSNIFWYGLLLTRFHWIFSQFGISTWFAMMKNVWRRQGWSSNCGQADSPKFRNGGVGNVEPPGCYWVNSNQKLLVGRSGWDLWNFFTALNPFAFDHNLHCNERERKKTKRGRERERERERKKKKRKEGEREREREKERHRNRERRGGEKKER